MVVELVQQFMRDGKKKLIDNQAEVLLEKGSLHINIFNEEAIMTGPAEVSYHGYVEI